MISATGTSTIARFARLLGSTSVGMGSPKRSVFASGAGSGDVSGAGALVGSSLRAMTSSGVVTSTVSPGSVLAWAASSAAGIVSYSRRFCPPICRCTQWPMFWAVAGVSSIVLLSTGASRSISPPLEPIMACDMTSPDSPAYAGIAWAMAARLRGMLWATPPTPPLIRPVSAGASLQPPAPQAWIVMLVAPSGTSSIWSAPV